MKKLYIFFRKNRVIFCIFLVILFIILYDRVNINKNKDYPPSTRALIEKPNFLPELTGKKILCS